MAIRIFHVDLRPSIPELRKVHVAWFEGMTAHEAVRQALGNDVSQTIAAALAQNDPYLTVSWANAVLDDHSEIGGVGSLDWPIPDKTTVVVYYEEATMPQYKEDQAMQWLLDNEHWAE